MAADSPKAIGVDPQEDKYLLQVTAGPSYEDAERYTVQVNGSDSCCIDNDLITAWVKVNIRGFHGTLKLFSGLRLWPEEIERIKRR